MPPREAAIETLARAPLRHAVAASWLALSVGLSGARAQGAPAAPPEPPVEPAPAPLQLPKVLPTDVDARADDSGVERVDLATAIQRALTRASALELAQGEIDRARALLRQARSSLYPALNGNADFTRLDHERRSNGVRVAPRDQLSAELALNVPLVVPRRWVATGQAADQVELARYDAASVRQQLALNAGQAYLGVMAQHRVIEVNERALANAKAHYDYAHTRFTGGIGNEIDDVRAGQVLASSVSQLERSRAGLVRAQEALGVLLGSDRPLDVVDLAELAATPSLEEGLSDLETRRADLRGSRARLQAAERVKNDAWADYLPFLVAEFRPFFTEPPTATMPHTGWELQLVLGVPLYDGQRYGLQDQREAELAQSRTQLTAALRQARSEVRVAFSEAERADASLAAAASAAELARQSLQMAMLAYQAGATTNIEVLDSERRARDAETQAVIAEDAARQARLELLVASGRWP